MDGPRASELQPLLARLPDVRFQVTVRWLEAMLNVCVEVRHFSGERLGATLSARYYCMLSLELNLSLLNSAELLLGAHLCESVVVYFRLVSRLVLLQVLFKHVYSKRFRF